MVHEAERKPRVLYVSHTAHWGGAEIVLARFLAQARQIEGTVLLPLDAAPSAEGEVDSSADVAASGRETRENAGALGVIS